MTTHSAHVPLAPSAGAAVPVSMLGGLWRAVIATVRRLREDAWAAERDAQEREALAGLDERMLKDVGASSWLVASAAAQARDDYPAA